MKTTANIMYDVHAGQNRHATYTERSASYRKKKTKIAKEILKEQYCVNLGFNNDYKIKNELL